MAILDRGVTQMDDASEKPQRKRRTELSGYRLRIESEDIVFDRRPRAEQLADDKKPLAARSKKALASCFFLADLFPDEDDEIGDWEISVTFTPRKEPR